MSQAGRPGQPGAAGEAVIEIRPLAPVGLPSGFNDLVTSKSVLRADPAAGTLLLSDARFLARRPPRQSVLALPSTGRADAVTAVRLVTYLMHGSAGRAGSASRPMWRMVLTGRDGQVLAATRAVDQRIGEQRWPPEILAPLAQAGLAVSQEHFEKEAELHRAYPGAAGPALTRTPARWNLLILAGTLVGFLIIAAAVVLSKL